MSRNVIIANRLREVLLNGRWIASTNFKDQLAHTSFDDAVLKISGLNSIAELTYHINYYMAGLLKVLNGGPLDLHDQFSFDLQNMNAPEDWRRLVEEFLTNAEAFALAVEKAEEGLLEEGLLDQPFVDDRYGTYLRNIERVIEHAYYHLGQVVLIRKMIESNN